MRERVAGGAWAGVVPSVPSAAASFTRTHPLRRTPSQLQQPSTHRPVTTSFGLFVPWTPNADEYDRILNLPHPEQRRRASALQHAIIAPSNTLALDTRNDGTVALACDRDAMGLDILANSAAGESSRDWLGFERLASWVSWASLIWDSRDSAPSWWEEQWSSFVGALERDDGTARPSRPSTPPLRPQKMDNVCAPKLRTCARGACALCTSLLVPSLTMLARSCFAAGVSRIRDVSCLMRPLSLSKAQSSPATCVSRPSWVGWLALMGVVDHEDGGHCELTSRARSSYVSRPLRE